MRKRSSHFYEGSEEGEGMESRALSEEELMRVSRERIIRFLSYLDFEDFCFESESCNIPTQRAPSVCFSDQESKKRILVLTNTLPFTTSLGVLCQNEGIYDFNDFSCKANGLFPRCILITIITADGCWAFIVC